MDNLQERYLHAVRRALPAAKADDIVAELRDILATRQEDREEALGRPLTSDETSAMLKEFGHPLVVAARYRPQQWLIGPRCLPLLLVRDADRGAGDRRHRHCHGRRTLSVRQPATVGVAAQTWGSLWMSLLINVGVLTIIFAVMERAGFPGRSCEEVEARAIAGGGGQAARASGNRRSRSPPTSSC